MRTGTQFTFVSLFVAASLLTNAEGSLEKPAVSRDATIIGEAMATSTDGTAAAATELRLSFQNAAVDLVLDHLSAAGHLIIHKETDARGSIDVQSKGPLTTEEAIQLVNASLKKLGCTLVRDGRVLTLASLDAVKNLDLEVVTGSDPDSVGKSEQVVTQIIPVRYVTASQLINNLQPLLPTTASLSVNESANTLILVATKTQIRRMLRIIRAMDISMARVSSVKVIPLRYADAEQLATVVQQLFSAQGSTQNGTGAGAFNFPGGGFGPPGAGGPPGASTPSESSTSATTASKVVAVADEQSNSLIVNASSENLSTVSRMVKEIDQPVAEVTELRLFTLNNADPQELADQLALLFADGTSQNSAQNQTPVFGGGGGPGGFGGGPGGFGGGPGGGALGGGGGTSASSTSTRTLKRSQVLAVPDPRTSSLLVSAAGNVMPQIAKMIQELDASPARKELVQVYELRNADPQDVTQIMQDLFNRSSTMRNNNTSDRSSLLGQGNPLTSRTTQQQNGTSSQGSGLGGNGGGGSGLGGGSGSSGF